jgi:hypothetical protein
MRKRVIAGVATVGIVGAGAVAWAALGGIVNVPDVVQGIAQGGGASSCQTTAVTFDVPEPTWNNSLGTYAVSTIGFSGITSACVTLGTADLLLTLTNNNGQTIYATATASNMSATSGTLNLSQPVPFDLATSGSFNYLVRNA